MDYLMDQLIKLAEQFINIFELGASTFVNWMISIVPVILMMLIAMNAFIALIGEKRIYKLAQSCTKNPILRYLMLPAVGTFMLSTPTSFSLGRFLPERYKPSYYASASLFCHTSVGMFPHINPTELFTFLGISYGIDLLGYSTTPLALRYLLVGLVMNFISGWITDFTTLYIMKQQGVELSDKLRV